MAGDSGPLFAVTHGGDLRFGDTLQQQRTSQRLRAPLAEADVVFPRAALVGIAFNTYADAGIGGQIVSMRGDQRGVIRADFAAVEVEIDGPILELAGHWTRHALTRTVGNRRAIGARAIGAGGL